MAKKIKMVMLFNSALDEREEYRVLNVSEQLLKQSKAEGGSGDMKKLLRKAIKGLFNGDIIEYFGTDHVTGKNSVTRKDVDYCIDELAKGHASNIEGEDFYWGDPEDVIIEL